MNSYYAWLLVFCLATLQDAKKNTKPPVPDEDPAKSVIDKLLNKEPTQEKSAEAKKKSEEKKSDESKEEDAPPPARKNDAAKDSAKKSDRSADSKSKKEDRDSKAERKVSPPPVPVPSDPVASGVKPAKQKSKRPPVQDLNRKKAPKYDDVVDEIANKGSTKHEAKSPPTPNPPKPTDQIVDGIMEQGDKSKEVQSLELFSRAKDAEKAGDLKTALSLAQKARDLAPANREIRGYTLAISQELSLMSQANANMTKAKAHLALSYSRATDLWNAGRYAEAADLLDGIVRAAALFPKSSEVLNLQKQAELQLDACRQKFTIANKTKADLSPQQKTGKVPPPPKPAELKGSDVAQSRIPPEITPPENAKRLLRINDADVPAWYASHKTHLATTISVSYTNDRLTTVLDEISRLTGEQFIIDGPIASLGTHTAAMIDMRVSGVAAESVLDLACQRCGLEYVMMEKAIVITTPARASDYLRQLPEALRNNWAATRVLFPDINSDLLASPPSFASERRAAEDKNVPAFLSSGKVFLKHMQDLLK